MADKESTFPWFRFYTEAAHDIKIESIAEETGIEYLVIFGAWTTLLCLASESPIRGSLYVTDTKRYSNVTVTNKLHCTKELSDQLIKFFINYGMLDIDENGAYRIINFLKRNPPSDNSSPRVQKHREKEKIETLQDRYSNGTDLDLDLNKDNTVPEKSSGNIPSKEKPIKPKRPLFSENELILANVFFDITGVKIPKYETKSQIAAAQTRWFIPIREMLDQVDGNLDEAKSIMAYAIDDQKKSKWNNISAPASIKNAFIAVTVKEKK